MVRTIDDRLMTHGRMILYANSSSFFLLATPRRSVRDLISRRRSLSPDPDRLDVLSKAHFFSTNSFLNSTRSFDQSQPTKSTMKLSTLALGAALTPVAASGFSMLSPYRFPRMQSLINEMDELFERDWPSTVIDEHLARMDKEMADLGKGGGLTLRRSSPRYELAESPDKFQVTVEVPEAFKLEDVNVELKADGKLLSITGRHEEKTDDSSFSSTFQQSFSLDPTVVVEELNANFSDGKVVISAPRKEMLPQLQDRKITIEGKKEVPVEEAKDGVKEETRPVDP